MDRLRLSLSRMERLLVQLKAALLNVPSKYRAKPLQRWRRLQSAVRDLERVERQLEAQQQELRLANQRLVESNKQLETVLENIPIMLSAGNEDRVFTWNKEFERVTGYSRHEVVDNPQILDRLFPDPVYRDHVLQRFRELRGYFRDWEVDVCCQDGTVRTILLSSVARDVPIPGWANWSVGVDITRRKQALQRTKLLQELIGELSKAVTPLQVSEVIVDQALKALGAQLGSVALLSEDGQYIVLLNRKGAPADVAQQYQCTPLDYPGPLTEAVRTSIPVWIETREEYVTFYPELVEALAKTGSQATACLPLIVHDRVLGGMGLSFAKPRRFALEDRDLLIALAHYCAQALERAQYHEREQLLAALNERQRLARDLHDAVSQLLFAIKMRAEALMRQHQRTPEMVPIRLEELYHLTSAAQSEMRALLLELQPARLAEADLGELLQQLTHSLIVRKLQVEITSEDEYPLPSDVKLAFYRIAQEAVANVVKHAKATRVVISLENQADQVRLGVVDNGRGFNPAEVTPMNMGLSTMRERAEGIGAKFNLQTTPGQGTQVWVQWGHHGHGE